MAVITSGSVCPSERASDPVECWADGPVADQYQPAGAAHSPRGKYGLPSEHVGSNHLGFLNQSMTQTAAAPPTAPSREEPWHIVHAANMDCPPSTLALITSGSCDITQTAAAPRTAPAAVGRRQTTRTTPGEADGARAHRLSSALIARITSDCINGPYHLGLH